MQTDNPLYLNLVTTYSERALTSFFALLANLLIMGKYLHFFLIM